MKRISSLLVGLITISALTSCGGNNNKIEAKNIKGGTAEERDAINNALGSVVSYSGATFFTPLQTMELQEDLSDYLLVSKSVTKKGKKVECEWEPTFEGCSFNLLDLDSEHQMVEVNYPGYKKDNGKWSLKLKKISCGGAVSDDPQLTWSGSVTAGQTFYKSGIKISDVSKVHHATDADQTGPLVIKNKNEEVVASYDDWYDLVDYSFYSAPYCAKYFKSLPENPEELPYYYCYVNGKIFYTSPDGNWALLGDGDNVVQLYCGSAYDFKPTRFPHMNDDCVSVKCELGSYCGNIQLTFVSDMRTADKSTIAEPTLEYNEITDEMIKAISVEYESEDAKGVKTVKKGHKQCGIKGMTNSLSNALGQIKGTYVKDSLKNKDKKAVAGKNMESGARYTFQMKVGEEIVTIAYDYHTDATGDVGIYNAIKAMATANDDTVEYTIKGTLRYSCNEKQDFTQSFNNVGEYQLVPFLANHIVKNA